MNRANYYEILEVDVEASEQEIKRAFYKKVRVYSNESQPEQYQLIREAYDTLSDEDKRRNYDEWLTQGDLIAILDEADSLYNQGSTDAAMTKIHEVLSRNPEQTRARNLLALCYIERSEYTAAIRILHKLLQESPDDGELYFQLARAHFYMNQFGEAERYAKRAILAEPRDDSLLLFLTNIYQQENRINDIISVLNNRLKRQLTIRELPIVINLWEYTMLYNYKKEVAASEQMLTRLAYEDKPYIVGELMNVIEQSGDRWIGFKHGLAYVEKLNQHADRTVSDWIYGMKNQIRTDTYYYGDHDYGEYAVRFGGKADAQPQRQTNEQPRQERTYEQPRMQQNNQQYEQAPTYTAKSKKITSEHGGSLLWAIIFGIIAAIAMDNFVIGIGIGVAWYFLGGLLKRIMSTLLGCGCLIFALLFIFSIIANIFM